ncbi:hypothetical protein [Pseudomonas syringae pv. coryli]|uniref:Uncharacterized protein n=1 Tax=Pseudomonas syringae pv. coryli TaxID=317659 RepID=A0A0P9MZB5_9PSED|nr:hypothetical protein [Pseudomonas syringae pv. coryli]KPW97832.1 Uncharacterized protein ALO75_01708 [Pseudomonas syringae pv. coryli]
MKTKKLGRQSRNKPGPLDPKLMYFYAPHNFRARYFPMFMFSIFMCIFSLAITTSIVTQAWFAHDRDASMDTLRLMMGTSLIMSAGGISLARGRLWGMWVLVALLAICLATVLVIWALPGRRVDVISSILGVLFPLLGFLSLNSKRHREMREQFLFNHAHRKALREEYKLRDARRHHIESRRAMLRERKASRR